MSRYSTIDRRMWGDAKVRAWGPPPPHPLTLWQYLLTGPHNTVVPGLFSAGEATLAEALGWSVEQFREQFAEIASRGMARADWNARLVWIPNSIRYNRPRNPNQVKGWRDTWHELPECTLLEEAKIALKTAVVAMGKGFAKAFPEGASGGGANGSGNSSRNSSGNGSGPRPPQEQDQEQEQEQERLRSQRARNAKAPRKPEATEPKAPPEPLPAAPEEQPRNDSANSSGNSFGNGSPNGSGNGSPNGLGDRSTDPSDNCSSDSLPAGGAPAAVNPLGAAAPAPAPATGPSAAARIDLGEVIDLLVQHAGAGLALESDPTLRVNVARALVGHPEIGADPRCALHRVVIVARVIADPKAVYPGWDHVQRTGRITGRMLLANNASAIDDAVIAAKARATRRERKFEQLPRIGTTRPSREYIQALREEYIAPLKALSAVSNAAQPALEASGG